MSDLTAFSKRVWGFYHQTLIEDPPGSSNLRRVNQADIASKVPVAPATLSRLLKGREKMQSWHVEAIVRSLIALECIKYRSEALALFKLMGISDFDQDLLRKLEDDLNGDIDEVLPASKGNQVQLSVPAGSMGEGYQSQTFFLDYEDRPQRPPVFISRHDELHEFQVALDALIHTSSHESAIQPRRVFLLDGQGGWGKSALLSQYVDLCGEQEGDIFWVYIDWEKPDISSYRSTAMMMDRLVRQFENKYDQESIHFPRFHAFQKAVTEQRNKIAEKVESLRSQYKGQSQDEGEFSHFLSGYLSPEELLIYRPQPQLSHAIVSDLLKIASLHPIVFFFDTWEVAWPYADVWLRRGLLQHCLTHPAMGHRFLFVIAGRWRRDNDKEVYLDDIRRFTHRRGIYYRELDGFTSDNIVQYFMEHPHIHMSISQEVARKMREITHGMPLAVEIVGSMAASERNIDQLVAELLEPDSEQRTEIIGQVLARFYRHLYKQPKSEAELDLDCIYSIALMRQGERHDDFDRRMQLLREIWLKIGLIHDEGAFWQILRRLRDRYSFLFDGAYMHADVYAFIRTGSGGEKERRKKICEQAVKICEAHLREREEQVRSKAGWKVEQEKLKDEQWQEWLLDLISYSLWRGDDVMEMIVNYYFRARGFGSGNFHLRLVALVRNDQKLYDLLPAKARSLVDQLATLPEWFGLAQQEAERQKILAMLKGEMYLVGLLRASEAALQKENMPTARKSLEEAENAYQTLESEEKTQQLKVQIANAYYRLGKKLPQVLQQRRARREMLMVFEKARKWNPEDPYIYCSLADILISEQRFAEARMMLDQALSLSRYRHKAANDRAQKLLERLAKDHTVSRSQAKHARLAMNRANSLVAQGAFQQAEQLYHILIESSSTHIPGIIKFSQLLRQLGRLEEALKLLETLKSDEIANVPLKAAYFDAQGTLLLASGQLNEAISAFRGAIQLSPIYLNPHYGLGRTFLQLSKPFEALEAFAGAMQCKRLALQMGVPIKALLFWVWNGEGLANLLAHNEDGASESFSVAEALARKSLEERSREYQAWSQLGLAYLGQGRYLEAKEAYQKFCAFEQIALAKGFLRDMLFDIELVGNNARIRGWQAVYEIIESLLSGRKVL